MKHKLFCRVHCVAGYSAVTVTAFIGAACIVLVAAAALQETVVKEIVPVSEEPKPEIVHAASFLSPEFYDTAYQQAPELGNREYGISNIGTSPQIRNSTFEIRHTAGLILPHHLIAAPLIASTLEAVKKNNYTRIIIIGPDHLSRASSGAITTTGGFKTGFGDVEPDSATIDRLIARGVVSEERSVFDAEHSINALVGFVKRSMPRARIVPILVNPKLTPEHAERLAAALPNDRRTLIIASVDFSHYQPDRVARLHDRTSTAALSSGDVVGLDDVEVDSPESLRVFMHAMEGRDALRMNVAWNTTSAELTSTPDAQETTSHLIALFGTGQPTEDDTVTLLSVGDMMFDRNVRTWMEKEGEEYPFAKIRGTEDRFFRGTDILMGNLEGAISARRPPEKSIDFAFDESVAGLVQGLGFDVVSLANNHALDQGRDGMASTQAALREAGVGFFGDQVNDDTPAWETTVRGKKIAFLGYNTTDNPLNEAQAEQAVRAAKSKNDIVIVMMHWGAEYTERPPQSVINHGRKLVDWGADVVIGAHPHVMQGMEVYNNKPIFWSLGNFIFDQYWSTETQRGLALGLAISVKQTTVYLYPLVSANSQPRLAVGDEDRALLSAFASRSDLSEELRAQAKTGIIEVIKN